ncbi:integral membrane protein [Paraphaeosphaeria sporulosa]
MVKEGDVGVVGGVKAGLPILMTMGAFLSIALYNVIELTFLIFAIFKRRKGLYFWSLLVATWGIVPHAIGFIFKFFWVISLPVLSSAIVALGWPCMVTGQSLVLYSRLHLVVKNKKKIRWVLYMIIFNAVVLHSPVIALALSAEATHSTRIIRIFTIYDKVQIVVFFIQEAMISIIYIYETVPTQFTGHYEIQTTYKTAVYSIKLKIEFSILNRLVHVVKNKHLLGNQGSLRNDSVPLSTWTSRKKSQFTISTGRQDTLVRVNGNKSGIGNGKRPTMKASDVSIEKGYTVDGKHKVSDSELISNDCRKPDKILKAHGYDLH